MREPALRREGQLSPPGAWRADARWLDRCDGRDDGCRSRRDGFGAHAEPTQRDAAGAKPRPLRRVVETSFRPPATRGRAAQRCARCRVAGARLTEKPAAVRNFNQGAMLTSTFTSGVATATLP